MVFGIYSQSKNPVSEIGSALVVPGDPRTPKHAPQRAYNLLSFGGDISQEKLDGSPVVEDGTDEAEVIGFLRYINGQMILAEVPDELLIDAKWDLVEERLDAMNLN